jgi:hypothetical protein
VGHGANLSLGLTLRFAFQVLHDSAALLQRSVVLDPVCPIRNHPHVSRDIPSLVNDSVKRRCLIAGVSHATLLSVIEFDPKHGANIGKGREVFLLKREGNPERHRTSARHVECPLTCPPQCYMAHYSYKAEDLSWPGALYLGTDGVLRPYYSQPQPAK